jgi:hypothetical protein
MRRFLNVSALWCALDARRSSRKLSWRQVAKEVGCGASTFTRLGLGHWPSLDAYLAMTGWLGCSADDFVEGPRESEEEAQCTVDEIGHYLRKDNALKPESAAAIESIVRTAYEQMVERES